MLKCWLNFLLPTSRINSLLIVITAITIGIKHAYFASAQIAPDASLGSESSVVTPEVEVKGDTAEKIDGGAIRDRNLFHSFAEFNVNQGQRVYFANPNNIEQIFTRVTGNNPSNINGTLGVDGAADLLLLNPNGIIFGDNGSLDLEGSFFGTTADGVLFEDNTEFSALQSDSSLLTISVPVGLQMGNSPGSIAVRSPLSVADGQNFFLVGGEINLIGNEVNIDETGINSAAEGIVAPGGRVALGSLAASGVVNFENNSNLVFPENLSRADININNYFINASAGGGGSIALHAKNLRLIDSFMVTGINSNVESTDIQAGDITIDATDAVILEASDNRETGILNATGENLTGDLSEFELSSDRSEEIEVSGNAGNIFIDTNSLLATGSFYIYSLTNGKGNAGSININARDSISLDLLEPLDLLAELPKIAAITSFVGELGTGDGADINLSTRSLFLNNTIISTVTSGAGNAGNTPIDVTDTVTANNSLIIADAISTGNAGNIEIDTRSLSTTNTTISSSTIGEGNAGNTIINATDLVNFVDTSLVAETIASGDAGSIVFESETADITLENSAISTAVIPEIDGFVGTGRGGDITINGQNFFASNSLVSSATGGIVTAPGLANAGDIRLNISNSITVGNGTPLFTSTIGEGNAGNLSIQTKNLNLNRGGQIRADTRGSGNSGTINIEAEEIELRGNTVQTIENEAVVFPSSITATTEDSGEGGIVNITANNLSIADGAAISVRSTGEGGAGRIFVRVDDSLELDNGIFSGRSDRSSGGEIEIAAGNIRLMGNSNIQTNVENGLGGGGNIILRADSIVAFGDSDILSFSADGRGGNIILDTDTFFASNFSSSLLDDNPQFLDRNSRVDINATGSISGFVELPEVKFLPNTLVKLSEDRIDAEEIVANSCVVRKDKAGGTFVITGLGGLRSRPGDAAAIDYATGTIRSIPEQDRANTERDWQPGDAIVEPEKAYRLSNGKLVLSRECS